MRARCASSHAAGALQQLGRRRLARPRGCRGSGELTLTLLTGVARLTAAPARPALRRKKKAVHKSSGQDDKRLQNTLKRLGVNTIPGIEEVNIFKDDTVIHFTNPKVQASIAANTYVISGPSQTKSACSPRQRARSRPALGARRYEPPGTRPSCAALPRNAAAHSPCRVAHSPLRAPAWQSCKTCCLASSTSWARTAFRT